MPAPGFFVVVEGPEGSGKSTLVRGLAARMASSGIEPVVVREADLTAQVIRPALAGGQVVLADRFTLSSEIYQVVGRGLDRELVLAGNAAATGGLRPDLTLVLDLPAGVGRSRQEAAGKVMDRLDRESAAFHERICQAYVAVRGPGMVHLDGSAPADRLLEAAWEAVEAGRPDLWRKS